MFKNLSILTLMLSSSLHAGITRIHSKTPHFVKFENGLVGHWGNLKGSQFLNLIVSTGDLVDVELNEQNEIKTIIPLNKFPGRKSQADKLSVSGIFEPTVIRDIPAAARVMDSFRMNDLPGSQCYDRAHVWAYEAQNLSGTRLSKAWIFFADHFIQKNKFKWWFHIAPLARINVNGSIEERVMDPEFLRAPVKVKVWTDKFMVQKQECREVQYYTDYSLHAGEDDCYLITSTPWFWQPRDLEEFAKSGLEKTFYIDWEIRHAYENAFGIRLAQ